MTINSVKIRLIALLLMASPMLHAQKLTLNRQEMIGLTPKWTGERFADGRPRVSDELLKRMKRVPLEQAWGYCGQQGTAINTRGTGRISIMGRFWWDVR